MTLSHDTLRGMWAGLPVAWSPEDTFDEVRYRQNVRRTCAAGAHGVYTGGTTGEFYAQTFEEWRAVATATVEECRAVGTPVQVGVTDLSTGLVVRKAEASARLGANAVQVALPFWLPLSTGEVVTFLADLAQAVPGMQIVLYGTPRTKTPVTPELLRRVVDSGAPVIGCKYTTTPSEIPGLVQTCPEVSFLVGEANLADGMAAGARGSCSAYIYACPRYMLRYYHLCEQGQWDEARAIQEHVRAWHAGPCRHLFEKGLLDSALDRVFARAAGFIDIELECRRPYLSASQADLERYRELCEDGFREFLFDLPAS